MFTFSGPDLGEEARMLGLAMIPGRHIISIDIDINVPDFRMPHQPFGYIKL